MSVELHLGDCLEVMRTLDENSVDTCITDPPYGLRFMGKQWDTFRQNKRGKNQLINMGNGMKPLDHAELLAFQEWNKQWANEVYRVLKPGALLLAFGGTRTYHRMVCAIEDAGFEIRDTIAWVYGSGFPKSHDISKAIDKMAGAEREVVERRPHAPNAGSARFGQAECAEYIYSAPSTPEAQLWDGWGTALKPAFEPIVIAMKPIDGTYAENALKWGVAGLWIDGGRIGTEGHIVHGKEAGKFQPNGGETIKDYHEVQGRFPSNLIHDGSDEVVELFPQTGKSTGGRIGNKGSALNMMGTNYEAGDPGYGDSGSAARFFYCAKASKSERNAGLEGMEIVEAQSTGWSGDSMPLRQDGTERKMPFKQNHHPTVKPLSLMRYLVRLTKTPTGGVVLDPFTGSGSTGCACVLEGRDFIGIEREQDYIEIADKRIEYWARQPKLELT
jgi:site-specific DNA-methyltransferase (adenine-specific)